MQQYVWLITVTGEGEPNKHAVVQDKSCAFAYLDGLIGYRRERHRVCIEEGLSLSWSVEEPHSSKLELFEDNPGDSTLSEFRVATARREVLMHSVEWARKDGLRNGA